MVEIREMKLEDLFLVAEIERENFKDPWSVAACRGTLENSNVYSVVAEDEGEIVGYGFIMGVADEAEVLRIAVIPDKRRQHIGSGILEDMLSYCEDDGYASVYLEVRAGNLPAIRMYDSFGFEKLGIRADYYSNPKEDALIMGLVMDYDEE